MRNLLIGLAYVFCMGLILIAGFFPVVALAGHSGVFSGSLAGMVWVAYGLAVLLVPWPVVQWLFRSGAKARQKDDLESRRQD